ncbi:ABC transporter E family member 2-like [Neltuma alba]|uniref:ABC transporter E family member 2-like n=1 Tax=Neltuma alba TaxID=207710 RepID=UPI0010A51D45|nr:ABC transporter E family member 2-like [Prosopis alba]
MAQHTSTDIEDLLSSICTHKHGSFELHGLLIPRAGKVFSLLGRNGIRKSTALSVLVGTLKPNLGRPNPPNWQEIPEEFRKPGLKKYFTHLHNADLKAILKPQYVDRHLKSVIDREVGVLSGGELQRLAIAMAANRNAEIYLFDEPSSYLDVKQRLKVAKSKGPQSRWLQAVASRYLFFRVFWNAEGREEVWIVFEC